jgi:hypothetical protein
MGRSDFYLIARAVKRSTTVKGKQRKINQLPYQQAGIAEMARREVTSRNRPGILLKSSVSRLQRSTM